MTLQRSVYGIQIDEHTRCAHYHQPFDVIAIKHYCCHVHYSCHACHEALADHPAEVWPTDHFHEPAVLCGMCGLELSVTDYLSTGSCPGCQTDFNPGCKAHANLYFAPGQYA
ncbi:CHY zinc finger protein [Yaniella flava]|uniref:CHY zinc finger protein n=1 Tax=Yaniella flava TaxID=287930 RepID=UPI0031D49C95